MIDKFKTSSINIYEKLCNRLKISNWRKQVFDENVTIILDNLENRVKALEKQQQKVK